MSKPAFRFNFKQAIEADRDLIHAWLKQAYIQEWVHGQGLEKVLQYQAQGKTLDYQSTITQHWLG